jgi:hypothetical protein
MKARIVADGMRRLRATGAHGAAKARIQAEVGSRHAAELRIASWWRRLWIQARMRGEVRRELEREFSPSALYAAHGRK